MNINFSCPINNTGYGIASLNLIKELYEIENDIAFFPIGNPTVSNKEDYKLFSKLLHNAYNNFDPNAVFVKIWHQFDLAQHIGKGKYFAYPFFELDTFNNLEKSHMSVPDVLLVSSEWAKQIVLENNIKTNCMVVPLGVDTNIFNSSKYIDNGKQKNKYIFLNIGKWEIRKGHDILLELFNAAFPSEDDVELWILASETTNNYSDEEELKKWKNMYSSPRIKLFNGVQSHDEIAQLISLSDCGLYPSRAEGWNLELLESMAMNKPVIATKYSAHTEFCDTNNSFLIDITEKEKAYDGKAFKGQGNWAKFGQSQKDQTIDYMRYVYSNKINTNKGGIETAKKYSWTNSALTLYRCINNL
jgi:glycosyltransferase involved in cell wall biosynthesis